MDKADVYSLLIYAGMCAAAVYFYKQYLDRSETRTEEFNEKLERQVTEAKVAEKAQNQ